MSIVYSLEEARSWFMSNTLGSVTAHRIDGQNKICWTLAEAEEFFGITTASPEELAEKYGIGSCCGSCRYWQHTSRNTSVSQKVQAECKRFPMVVLKMGNDWCGEYKHTAYSSYAVQPWPVK